MSGARERPVVRYQRVEDNTGNPSSWSATFHFSQGSGSTWHVTGSMIQAFVSKAAVVGAVHCAAINVGAHGYTFIGTIAPNGKAASGTWATGDDSGSWAGAFSPATGDRRDSLDGSRRRTIPERPRHELRAVRSDRRIRVSHVHAGLGSDCDQTRASGVGHRERRRHILGRTRSVSEVIFTSDGAVNCVKTQCVFRAENTLLASDAANTLISFAKTNVACGGRLSCQASLSAAASTASTRTHGCRGRCADGSARLTSARCRIGSHALPAPARHDHADRRPH